jgi:hypothetical protein
MIQGQEFCWESISAVLAGEVISDVNIFTTEANGSIAPGPDIGFQLYDARQLKARADRSDVEIVILDNFHFILKPENKGFLPRYDFHRLIRSVEQQ